MDVKMSGISETFTQQYETILLNMKRDPHETLSRSLLVSAIENDLKILLREHQESSR